MDIVVIDSSDVRIGDYYVGQVAKRSNAVGQANREEGEGEICGAEKGIGAEGWAAMSG